MTSERCSSDYIVSLLDRHGVRHEIDLETWTSRCVEWVVDVHNLNEHGGRAIRFAPETVPMPIHTLGSMKTEFVAHTRNIPVEEARFTESLEPITCLACVAGLSCVR